MPVRAHQILKGILGVGDADDIVSGSIVYRQAGMPGFRDGARHLGDGCARRDAINIGTGRHDVLHLKFIQRQNGKQHGAFFSFQLSFLAGLLDSLLEVILVSAAKTEKKPRPHATVGISVQGMLLVFEG